MNALPNNAQKIIRKHGKSYLVSTRRRAFTIRNREHEEKWNFVKHFTVDSVTERDCTRRKVVVESACYTSIYVFDTTRRTTRFKVRKALYNKFVCVFITRIQITRFWNLLPALLSAKKIDRDLKVSESCCKIDSIVATRAYTVTTTNKQVLWR